MKQDSNTLTQSADVNTAIRIESALHRRTRMNALQYGTTMTALVNRGLELANDELEKKFAEKEEATS